MLGFCGIYIKGQHRRSYHCGTEAAASVVIIVNHIHTLAHALCASLQSAAVQDVIHELGLYIPGCLSLAHKQRDLVS